MYGLAIDLGTTTLAASLVDAAGRRCAVSGTLNPQRRFGADVVSRLDAAVNDGSVAAEMTALIRDELRRLGEELCGSAGIAWRDVTRVAIAGNPAMQHLLLGLPLETLAFPPFRPRYSGATVQKVAELGWDGVAELYLFPMPGGFVGGDTVAFLYGLQVAAGSDHATLAQTLCLDLGTNGEIALLAGETIWATSAAAGPAFEGGNLSCGMAALPGAISSVTIVDDRLRLQVIGAGQPLGICGSAALEATSELLRCGIVDDSGRLLEPDEIGSNLGGRIVEQQGERAFVLHRDARRTITLSQNDIRQLQLAKAALRAGIEVLIERARIRHEAVQQVILTGSFGAVVKPQWLKTVGIFNESMVQTTRFTPEGALAGAEALLLASDGVAEVEQLAARFRVVPLSGTPLFEELFIQHINFPT
jgi:uncharacterized 2Fe-2S/4Fe-4S cluster protein (DUF4445 family)